MLAAAQTELGHPAGHLPGFGDPADEGQHEHDVGQPHVLAVHA
jgi:hypothetical protein